MFTGLVEGIGKVRAIHRLHDDMTVTIAPCFNISECRLGDSVSVNGACLTITDLLDDAFNMDVSKETLSCSTLGGLRQGAEVNLERALRLSDRLGGHLVSGHVDGIGKILKKAPQNRSWIVRIGVERILARYIIEKGSIAVDGISLTVNECGSDFFEVNIIVHTGKETTLLKRKVGDAVNIETDLIGKYVEKLMSKEGSMGEEKKPSNIDLEMLIKNGFGE